MNHLLRELAPIPDAAWKLIDDEARERLVPLLAARRVVDFDGGGRWNRSASNLGRTTALGGPPPGGPTASGIRVRQRRVLPLVEVRVPFTLDRAELDDVERGAVDPVLDDLAAAARRAAEIETRAVFHGWPEAGITGITEVPTHSRRPLGEDAGTYPRVVAQAVEALRVSGIEGPYALVIGPAGYTRIVETTEHGGYPMLSHLTKILGGGSADGSVVWAPGLDGAVVVSSRGGDFQLKVGQDFSIGYSHHDADTVSLYLEESFTFRIVEPDAAVVLPA
ncbi:family 1 encapsulin nanocompartment shell protein [Pseudonocardia sp. GCM10023141]|uniref:family 1 encapsulin nanocompartment shell protein n=1 Tax=Pseudonocardia sp. GCM10023141 TaxID=3252653 RepID=UPI00361C4052